MKLKGKAKAAFLRKMAKGRNKKHGGHKKHRKHRKAVSVKGKKHHRGHFKRKVRRVHRRASGAIQKYLPKTEQLVSIATSYAYGKIEGSADKDSKHVLNSVPSLVPQIGRAGNAGAIAWLIAVVTRQPTLKAIAGGVLHVAAYQHARGAGFTKEKQQFTMGAGGGRSSRNEALVEDYLRRQNRD